MQLPVPSSEHPQVQIETVTPSGTVTTTVDKTHKVADIQLPAGTDESRLQHFARYLTSRGQHVGEAMAYVNGSWESLTEELHAKLTAETSAAEEKAKEKAAEAEKAAKAAADTAKAKAKSAADAAKAKIEAVVKPVEAKVEAHKTEISAAVETAKIAAEVAG